MLTAFDFTEKYDTKPTKRKLVVYLQSVREDKVVEQLYCVVFKDGGLCR